MKRGSLYLFILLLIAQCMTPKNESIVMTVKGPISSHKMGRSLIHEHILVDFIGANEISDDRWEKSEVIEVVMPYLKEVQTLGCETLFDCTPNYLGRDPELLRRLSDSVGINIITNTGYYGARDNKFLPPHAFTETADQLAGRWISEWENGINETNIKPGFIKIGVDRGPLSELHQKLITAAARTHLKTGLTIASHTGPAIPAFEEMAILKKEGVSPEAFIWVHAQVEKDISNHIKAAQEGAWISLDGLNDKNPERYLTMINNLKNNGLLGKVLISHDAGWFSPGEEGGGNFKGYTPVFKKLIPLLKAEKYSTEEINQLLIDNPRNALEIKVRRQAQASGP
ncbi:phosphotriesterase [Fulvivirgaceae bacterium BMA12]|uniref:Phosphotriesterase n=1 Tax=Agaribacillus aureus TaxID=3051825 RepID=A0ABT8L749_9BACT|nr:phosphotriesterase [Fulvivirgaceae bacterium BMA12]